MCKGASNVIKLKMRVHIRETRRNVGLFFRRLLRIGRFAG